MAGWLSGSVWLSFPRYSINVRLLYMIAILYTMVDGVVQKGLNCELVIVDVKKPP